MATRPNNIIPFPREVIVDQKIRQCERMIEKLYDWMENYDPSDMREAVRAETAPGFIDMWNEDLKKALAEKEMLTADDAFRFRGMVYRAQPSQNGAH